MLEGETTIQCIAEVTHVGVPHRPARPQAAEPDQRSLPFMGDQTARAREETLK